MRYLAVLGWFSLGLLPSGVAQSPAPSTAPQSTEKQDVTVGKAAATRLPRGKKLILKDGTFQLVRSYERNGDRVRYYSVERSAWEEIPAAMVDWDATAKAETEAEKSAAALAAKVGSQERASQMGPVLDVDASLQVAPNVFLPSGEGMFALEQGHVTLMVLASAGTDADKKSVLKQVFSPVPVTNKHNVELAGARATLRLTSSNPEFYLREAPDPAEESAIKRSSRPRESLDVELIRATVKGGRRRLESLRSLQGQAIGTDRNAVSIQQWDVAPYVYRFTLSEPLPPGEYAFAEILSGGLNAWVWDFGVDSR